MPRESHVGLRASSAVDLPAEGILVPEPEVEVEAAEATAVGKMDDPAADEEAKRHLRDQLRRTLSHKNAEAQPAGECVVWSGVRVSHMSFRSCLET